MKRKVCLGLCLGLLMMAFSGGRLFAAPYDFETGNQGWVSFNVELNGAGTSEQIPSTGSSAAHDVEGSGNGYIYLPATSALRPRPYSIGTTSGFSALGDLNGKTLTSDFKRMGDDFQTMAGSAPTVRWVIADTDTVAYGVGTWYVSKVGVSPSLNGLTTDWQTYGLEMTADNFFLWPHGTNAVGGTPASFEDVLSGYHYVGFTLLSSAADDSGFPGSTIGGVWSYPDLGAYAGSRFGVDNIDVLAPVPIPGALWLLGSGLLGLFAIRRRRG